LGLVVIVDWSCAALKTAILAAGAAGMYCGSCMRDNTLAAALLRAGEQVLLTPLYTPLRTDEPDVSEREVLYGGVNVFLEQLSGVFRHTPRVIDWLLNRRAMLRLAGRFAGKTDPARLGPLAVSILKGRQGRQQKEVDRLVDYLEKHFGPDVVSLPNAMFVHLARPIRRALGSAVICELTGEDIFLDALVEPHRSRVLDLIRAEAGHVDRFVATSRYYADRMAGYLGIPPERIDVVYPGIHADDLAPAPSRPADRPPTVGYLARVCPEKGLHRLVEAFAHLRTLPGMQDARLRSAGYLSAAHRGWLNDLRRQAARAGWGDAFTHVGEVDRAGKREHLHAVDILSVPAVYAEPKGMYVLEALACGVPFVGFDHGAMRELSDATGGCVLVAPNDTAALAEALAGLHRDADRRTALGAAGREAVLTKFNADEMARRFLKIAGSIRQ
jgi:glycosyltransferase involved in cell wall biosynthesis